MHECSKISDFTFFDPIWPGNTSLSHRRTLSLQWPHRCNVSM